MTKWLILAKGEVEVKVEAKAEAVEVEAKVVEAEAKWWKQKHNGGSRSKMVEAP